MTPLGSFAVTKARTISPRLWVGSYFALGTAFERRPSFNLSLFGW